MFVNALKYSRKFSFNGGIRYLSNIMDNDFNSTATTACKVFSPNAGKYGPEKNPYLDTFHAVDLFLKMFIFWLFIYFCLFNYVIIHKSNHHRCSMKKVSQNSQESTCVRFSFLIKLHASGNDFD